MARQLLILFLFGAAICKAVSAGGKGPQLTDTEQKDEQRYHDLLVARADAVGKSYQAKHEEFIAGRGTSNFYLSTARRLRDAELALAANVEERRAILEEYWAVLWICEHIQKELSDSGRISFKEWAEAASRLYEAELAVMAERGRRRENGNASTRRFHSRFSQRRRDEAEKSLDKQLADARSKLGRTAAEELGRSMYQADLDAFVSREKNLFAGRATLPFLTDAVMRLRDTRLALAKNRVDRFAALQDCWMTLRQNQASCEVRFDAGRIGEEELMEAGYARLMAEQALHDAWLASLAPRASVAPWLGDIILRDNLLSAQQLVREETESAVADSEERAKLMLRYAQVAWDVRSKEFRQGRGTLWFQLDSARRLVDAELALVHKPAERIGCLERYRKNLEDIEGLTQRRYEAKSIEVQELMDARYARLEADIRLAEAKHTK